MAWTKARWLTPQEGYDKELSNLAIDAETGRVYSVEDKDKLIKRLQEKYGWNGAYGPQLNERDLALADLPPFTVDQIINMLYPNISNAAISNDYIQIYPDTDMLYAAKDYGWEEGYDDEPEEHDELAKARRKYKELRIPKSFIKDKDKLESLELYKEFINKIPEDMDYEKRSVGRKAYRFLTNKALKNILKSTNIRRATKELHDFIEDYGYSEHRDATKKFDSLNQIREYPAKIAYAQDLTESLNEMYYNNSQYDTNTIKDIYNTIKDIIDEEDELDRIQMDSDSVIDMLNHLSPNQQIDVYGMMDKKYPDWKKGLPTDVADDESDFPHVPIISGVLSSLTDGTKYAKEKEKNRDAESKQLGINIYDDDTRKMLYDQDKRIYESKNPARLWRVISNKQDMINTGKELEHCYGDLQRYGSTHHKNYCRRLHNNQSILLTNGDVTAEIQLTINPRGEISYAEIGQVQGKGNTSSKNEGIYRTQLEDIAHNLLGKTFDDQITSDKRCKFVHRMETHDFDREPNLIAAINRRF